MEKIRQLLVRKAVLRRDALQKKLDRMRELAGGAVSAQEIDDVKLELELAKCDVELVEATGQPVT